MTFSNLKTNNSTNLPEKNVDAAKQEKNSCAGEDRLFGAIADQVSTSEYIRVYVHEKFKEVNEAQKDGR